MDVEKFVRHLCRLVLRHQMPVWNYFVNSFYSVWFQARRPYQPNRFWHLMGTSGPGTASFPHE
jgi:hypothetical protein